MLLDHTSGLKSYVPFYIKARGSRARAIDLLYAQPLLRVPGDSAEYSDLNALFLGLILEKVSGLPLDQLATARGVRAARHEPDHVQAAALAQAAHRAERHLARANRCRAT